MSLKRTSIGSFQTWTCSAMIPSLSNFGSSRSMIRVPFRSMVTCDPLAVITNSFQPSLLSSFLAFCERIAIEHAAASLFVEQAPLIVGHVSLRSGNHAVRLTLATKLNARIAVPDLDLGLEHEVAIALVGRQEFVFLEGFVAGPADDLAVLDGEKRLVRRCDPTRQVLAVKERMEPAGSWAETLAAATLTATASRSKRVAACRNDRIMGEVLALRAGRPAGDIFLDQGDAAEAGRC